MSTTTRTAAATADTTVVTVNGALTTAPKTTYDPVDAGWVEISWVGGVLRTTVRVCDGGRGVPDYWWGHTYPTISREALPYRLWNAVCEYIKAAVRASGPSRCAST
jgi:hypothetical protein